MSLGGGGGTWLREDDRTGGNRAAEGKRGASATIAGPAAIV